MVQPLWKTVWRFLKKLKVDLPFDPAIALLGIYPKKTKTIIHKNVCIPEFMTVLFTIARIWRQPKCPSMDDWIEKLWFIYTRAPQPPGHVPVSFTHLTLPTIA